MRYKVWEEVVLSDRLMIHVIGSKRVVISGFNYDGDKYETKGGNAIWYFNDDQIDHDKTAELNGLGELEKIVAEKNKREVVNVDDAIEPAHYRQGNIDRIEVWYQTMPFDGFRWAMKSHIHKYIMRYDLKGGLEDLEKAEYYIKRLKEKELDL